MKIADKTVVELHYSLHLGDGVIVDHSEQDEPLTYLHGLGQIVPGLERALAGLAEGEKKQVVVGPEEGYGTRDPSKVQNIAMTAFGGQPIAAGDSFVAMDPEGNEIPVKIVSVQGDRVMVDFNHPLAGESLHFSITVGKVREATPDELEHGHAHDGEHAH